MTKDVAEGVVKKAVVGCGGTAGVCLHEVKMDRLINEAEIRGKTVFALVADAKYKRRHRDRRDLR